MDWFTLCRRPTWLLTELLEMLIERLAAGVRIISYNPVEVRYVHQCLSEPNNFRNLFTPWIGRRDKVDHWFGRISCN